ncbi:hypothetical protein GMD78_13550 [Ornithinibacillus sp. L9]|uniref:Uncharacterized protein n=1 Tax=Ornithinibacillus caprae TaxID=2678566 RepID=A0A6N8FPH8_9BACI|nr:hypothetical protein [Ornithinibacillus caprae]MUK89388.1 hypothetical protein [Ornithinibacillus caprae]
MHKGLYRLGIIVVLLAGIIIYLDINNRISSYQTPIEAMNNLNEPILEIQEPLDPIYTDDDYAYIPFYSEIVNTKDYLGVALFKKGNYGWKYVDMFGAGTITKDNTNGGLSTGKDRYYIGLATADVSSVILQDEKAHLIPLTGTDFQLWLFHQIDPNVIGNEPQFLDKTGNVMK